MDNRKQCIDSLKGIGILGVVLVHYGIRSSNDFVNCIVGNGARGVQLLFIINAFLIFNSLNNVKWNKESILAWYKRKFLRLIPLYWFFTLLYVALIDTNGAYYLGPLPKVSWLNILCNLFFVHGFYPYYTNSINANWFMGVLGIFYIVAPFLHRIINSLEKAIMLVFLISPAGFMLRHILLTQKVLTIDAIWNDYVNIISFPSEFPIILLGILLYYIHINIQKSDYIRSKKIFSVTGTFFAGICMLSVILNKGYFMIFNNIFSFGVVFSIFVLCQITYPIVIFNNKFLAFIGKHSYGIYLSHIMIIKMMNRHFPNDSGLLGYCIIVLAAVVISIISEKLIEEKLVKFIVERKNKRIGGIKH